MNQKFKRRFFVNASFAFGLWVVAFYLLHFQLKYSISFEDVKSFEQAFQEKCDELENNLSNFITGIESNETPIEKFEFAQNYAQKTDIAYFIYINDTLTLWTSNVVPVANIRDSIIHDGNIIRLDNGWYKFESATQGNKEYLAAMLIKYEYDFENEELVNEFASDLMSDFKGNLVTDEDVGFPVYNKYNKRIFNIAPDEAPEANQKLELIIFCGYLISFILLIQILILSFQTILIKKPFLLVIFPLLVVIARIVWVKTGWLGPFEQFEIFSPELFASETVVSFGDLMINVSLFYLLVHFLLKRTRNWFSRGHIKVKMALFLVPLFFISFVVAHEINNLIKELVIDSQISFNLEYLFDLSIYSFIGIALIGTSFYCYFKLVQYIIIQLKKSGLEANKLAVLWFLSSVVFFTIDWLILSEAMINAIWPVLLTGILLWFYNKERESKFLHVISMLAIISFYAAYILKSYADKNELNERKALAEIIADDRDESAEFEYRIVAEELQRSKFLIPYFTENFSQKKLNNDLESGPFKRLKSDFDLSFYLFKRDRSLVEDFKNYEVKGYDRFIETIRESGQKVEGNSQIYYIQDYRDKLTYIGHLFITAGDSLHGHLFTEMRSKKFPEEIGLPSLLLEKPLKFSDQLKHYSVAKYVDNKLVNRKGDYSYPLNSEGLNAENNELFIQDKYEHFLFQSDNKHKIVISKQVDSGYVLFTSFSYVLILFSALVLIPIGYEQLQKGIDFKISKLNVRIQFVLVTLVLITLISFAIGAGTFVEDQFVKNNIELIKEKTASVKTEVESKLKDEKVLRTELSDYLEYLLKKFSNIFITDINLYTLEGDLLASSQPKIYSRGILSKKINPEAFKQMFYLDKSEFVNQEEIGAMTYLSAYAPLYNKNGEKLAFLNVQYLSKQDELENQISGFLIAIINITVLMLALSILLAIVVSNRLTLPLKYIQESLKNIQIGSASKPIQYDGTDEIGELVKEYNKKVEELQMNAEQLAKSERESAWREMAKQVAHEIKNPLTPMKLSIQHLKRSINLADDDSKEKLDRITQSLIEQIDALTQIANEFSNFAKMPKATESENDLIEILRNAVTVFKDDEEYTLRVQFDDKKQAPIWADKDLLLRVFNNLIKNASQALKQIEDEDADKIIEIDFEETVSHYVVAIRDNGPGISDSLKDKIFVPYFTTKSTGTGLGLAMSKQIIESHNGKIWFETAHEVGTTFYIMLPKYSTKNV